MPFTPSPQAVAATTLLDANLTSAGYTNTTAPGVGGAAFYGKIKYREG